jgi:sugar phosphate isomerase/epimerase
VAVANRVLSLAAGTIPPGPPAESVRVAAAAGFDAVGLRFDLRPPSDAELDELRVVLDDSGVFVLDVEVIRLGITPPDEIRRLVDVAASIGARHLLVTGQDDDVDRLAGDFAALCSLASPAGMRPALEFMAFTDVATLADAVSVVRAAADPAGAVLVDLLHLCRSGGGPEDLAGVDPALLPYVQLCDAPASAPPGGHAGLLAEARHTRVLPGEGGLPVQRFVARLPADTAVSVEVQSDEMRSTHAAGDLARLAAETARRAVDSR